MRWVGTATVDYSFDVFHYLSFLNSKTRVVNMAFTTGRIKEMLSRKSAERQRTIRLLFCTRVCLHRYESGPPLKLHQHVIGQKI